VLFREKRECREREEEEKNDRVLEQKNKKQF
jgi:hypothetical protein